MENSSKTTALSLQFHLISYLLLLFFMHNLVVPVTGDSNVTPCNPVENITIDCGSSAHAASLDGRPWIGDVNGKFRLVEQKNSNNKSLAIKAASPLPSSVDQVPYSTARLSYSEFTYSIRLTPGPKFIRFYFYPASYPGIESPSNKAFFSVKAGRFTLLTNFSALLHARGKATLVKEFCVNFDEGQRLHLTFTPSPDIIESYAFINGIEVVSMPTNLYYPASDDGLPFLGQKTLYPLGNSTAFEKMYRVNVGGREISPADDTGMFRGWMTDDDYLTIAKPSALPVNTSVDLTFSSSVPSFTAPREVYVTARTMGTNKTENENYYLTWEFPVDSGFIYLVRLHFCEFQIEITKQGDRVFQIFLANLTAETQADVIVWSGGNGIPVYQDYVVAIGRKGNQKYQNLSIALHPAPAWRTLYSDAILNGLEIFKLSNNLVLAGLNPDPVSTTNTPGSSPTTSTNPKDNNNATFGIVGIGCAVGLITLLSLLACMVVWRTRKGKGSWWRINRNEVKSTRTSLLPDELCSHFSLDEIKAATNNFHDDLVVGKGGFGKVYKGFMEGGEKIVAIKRLNPESSQGIREFLTEIKMLPQLRHVHLVSLIGYCNENQEMILVYDFMRNGTLSDHLYGSSFAYDPLTWIQRLEICKGAASGLNYLHTEVKHTIIHRDVKTSNILLDDKFTAKVSDFGLSKTDPKVEMLITGVKGTRGYLDPQYARGHNLTEKSDVYAFGVVLFEVLCARKALDTKLPEAQMNLAHWAKNCITDGTLYKVIDPYLIGKIAPECFKVFVEIAESCIEEVGINRPSMNDVMEKLGFAIELQEAADVEKARIDPASECSYPDIVFPVARDMDFNNESEVDAGLESNLCSGISIFDSDTAGLTYPFSSIDSSTSLDPFSSTTNTKST